MGNSGRRNYPFNCSRSGFQNVKEIENGIIEYIKDGYLSYGPFSGIPEFKKVLQNILIPVKTEALLPKMF
jgi:hypothetical protein